jgi:hypothetical protein
MVEVARWPIKPRHFRVKLEQMLLGSIDFHQKVGNLAGGQHPPIIASPEIVCAANSRVLMVVQALYQCAPSWHATGTFFGSVPRNPHPKKS